MVSFLKSIGCDARYECLGMIVTFLENLYIDMTEICWREWFPVIRQKRQASRGLALGEISAIRR